MKIIAIVIARLDSQRLANKALIEVKGRPIINYVLSRAKKINGIKKVVLATTKRNVDNRLAEHVSSCGIDVFRGPTNDVALRMLECAKTYGASYFIRINGDSPFLDPVLISKGLNYCSDIKLDLITNIIGRTYPYGISVEILKTERYESIYRLMQNETYLEHPTQYFYENSEKLNIKVITSNFPELNKARLAIDTPDDINIFKKIIAVFGSRALKAGYKEVARIYLDIMGGKNDHII